MSVSSSAEAAAAPQPAAPGTSAPPVAVSAPAPTPSKKSKGVPIKICLVGAGRLGSFRLALMRESRRCSCVAIVEPDRANPVWAYNDAPAPQEQQQPQQQPQDAGDDSPPRVFASLAQVDVRFDAVWIAAPPERHAELIAQAADVTRFVFCEPPVATSITGVRQCYDLCQSKGVELLCGWHRRYDDAFLELHDKVSGMRIVSASFVSKGTSPPPPKPCPPASALSIFQRRVAPELNLALMYMCEQMPVSVQATGRDTYGLGEWDSAFCSLEYPQGRTIFIEVSSYGSERFENSIRIVADGQVHSAGSLDPSTAAAGGPRDDLERYARACRTEVNRFARLCALDKVPRVCTRDHCEAVAQLVAIAEQSAKLGSKLSVEVGPSMRLLRIGDGKFARHIEEKVISQMPHVETVAVINSRSTEEQLQAALQSPTIDSIYIALPFKLHTEFVERCIGFGKKILCEKPVLDLPRLQKMAIERDVFFMIGLHRRFDRQFQKAKELTTQLVADNALQTIVVESRDTGPHMDDTIDTLWCCCIHDFDMISWLLEDVDCEISVKDFQLLGAPSSFRVSVAIWLRKFDKTVDAEIQYGRNSPSYINRVHVNGTAFGHDFHDPVFYNAYNDAYQREFKFLASHPGNIPGQGKFCLTYTRGYLLTAEVVELVNDDEVSTTDDKALSAVVKRKSEVAMAATLPPTIEELKEFRGVAGHSGILTQGGRLYKPLMHDENEWLVYEMIREQLPDLVSWIPRVYERTVYNGIPYMVMDDLTVGYRRPVVLDLKIGEPSDFLRLQNQPYAMKIAGYSGDNIVRRAQQSWSDLQSYFKDFIKDKATGNCRYEVLPDFVEQLQQLYTIFSRQTLFHLRAVSLLLIYDSTDSDPQQPAVRIVDMARVHAGTAGIDHFFCFGLENSVKLLNSIHDKFVNRHAVFLCRHGLDADVSSASSQAERGPRDPPLSVEGMQQAYDMSHRLRYENMSIIITSPSYRAIQTAKVIAQQLGIKYAIEPAMCSFTRHEDSVVIAPLSPFDALESAQLASDPLLDRLYTPAPMPEQLAALKEPLTYSIMQARVHSALSSICSRYKRVVIVAHTSTFEALLSLVSGQPAGFGGAPISSKPGLQFASITSMLPTHSAVGWAVERLNMSSHLTVFRGSPGLIRLPVVSQQQQPSQGAVRQQGAAEPQRTSSPQKWFGQPNPVRPQSHFSSLAQ